MLLLLLASLLVCAAGFQLRAECHAFHFSQGMRISALRQELQNISQIELQCTIVKGGSGCSCSSIYIGDAGKESIWLVTLEPVSQCNVSSEIIVNAMYKQAHGISSSEIRLQVTNGAVSGYCGMELGLIKSTVTFLTPSQITRINSGFQTHKLTIRKISRAKPSALCPDYITQTLQHRIKESTYKSHAALMQEIQAVVRRLSTLACPSANLILLAAENKYMSLRAATLSVFVRLVCHGLSAIYIKDNSAQTIAISLHPSSKKELTNMLMSIILDLLYALSDHSESGMDRISEILFDVSVSKLKALFEQRAAVCFVHGLRAFREYTFLDPNLSGFMHCVLQPDFIPHIELTTDKHMIDLVRAINVVQKQQAVVQLSPKSLGITSIRIFAHFWDQWQFVCFIIFVLMVILIVVTYTIYIKWHVIRHLFFSKRSRFKHEKIPLHIKPHEMV